MKLYCRDDPSTLRAFLNRCKLSGEERLDELKCSKKGKYQYHKRVYIDGLLSTEKAIIAELKQIINDLKEIRNYEYSSKNKLIS